MPQSSHQTNTSAGKSTFVLIPVDFSPKGELALRVGFELAKRLELEVRLLHASTMANPTLLPQFPDDFYGMDNENEEIEEVELENEVRSIDEHAMAKLKKAIESKQNEGFFPPVLFQTAIAPGMPEEVISEYCQISKVSVIVMATRGKDKRREELIGSVTAEVIDHAFAPVFTVPEEYTFKGFKQIVRICTFCYFDDGDKASIAHLMDMFGNPDIKVWLYPATDKLKGDKLLLSLKNLQNELAEMYPNDEFIIPEIPDDANLRKEVEKFFIKEDIQMILAPNRKRNAISRFFNPGLPHKILYELDFPMLAIPV